MNQNARVSVRYEFHMHGTGRDGRRFDLGVMDDSFSSWRKIVAWNLHYRRWAALRLNARDLFTKVLFRHLRRSK